MQISPKQISATLKDSSKRFPRIAEELRDSFYLVQRLCAVPKRIESEIRREAVVLQEAAFNGNAQALENSLAKLAKLNTDHRSATAEVEKAINSAQSVLAPVADILNAAIALEKLPQIVHEFFNELPDGMAERLGREVPGLGFRAS